MAAVAAAASNNLRRAGPGTTCTHWAAKQMRERVWRGCTAGWAERPARRRRLDSAGSTQGSAEVAAIVWD